MPTVGIKFSSWRYKFNLKHSVAERDGKYVNLNLERRVSPNASFVDGVATKDCVIDPVTALSIRIFLPQNNLLIETAGNRAFSWLPERAVQEDIFSHSHLNGRRSLDGTPNGRGVDCSPIAYERGVDGISNGRARADMDKLSGLGAYFPRSDVQYAKIPVIVQFHDGAFINGGKDNPGNDTFCRRVAKACKSVVIAVGYGLAPEHRYPSASQDGVLTLKWLATQANIINCTLSSGMFRSMTDNSIHSANGLIDSFAHMIADPWISAHVDFSRCMILGSGAGGNVAQQVTRAAVKLGRQLEPLSIVGQILICPFFGGVPPLPSEVALADTYYIDKETMQLVWKLVLPEGENSLSHPGVDPLLPGWESSLKSMPSSLVISAELDMMRDRAAAYVEALRSVHVDATLVTYRKQVHGFATMDFLMNTKPAQACLEDISIWFDRHVCPQFLS